MNRGCAGTARVPTAPGTPCPARSATSQADERRDMDEWKTLKDHIRKLLLEGKRGNHPDYIPFFEIFGKERIVRLAKEVLKEEKENDESIQVRS